MNNQFSNEQLKYLDYIQNTITRMNTNSFQLKGWAITLNTAILGIIISNNIKELIILAVLELFAFSYIDAYYLCLERKYRALYREVVEGAVDSRIFDMNINKFDDIDVWSSYLSKSILGIYITQIFIDLLLMCVLYVCI